MSLPSQYVSKVDHLLKVRYNGLNRSSLSCTLRKHPVNCVDGKLSFRKYTHGINVAHKGNLEYITYNKSHIVFSLLHKHNRLNYTCSFSFVHGRFIVSMIIPQFFSWLKERKQ